VQAAGIHEARTLPDGTFLYVPVGGGKTLISMLLPAAIGAQKALLLVPAYLARQTEDVIRELSKDWHFDPPQVMTFQTLSRESGAEELFKIAPDVIIVDEAHNLKNMGSARWKPLHRYLKANPATRFFPMTGTLTRRSIFDFWHLAVYSLRDRCPIPRLWQEAKNWGDALDESIAEWDRVKPGALRQFCGHENPNTLAGVRNAVGRRIQETPGVIFHFGDQLDVSLTYRRWRDEPEVSKDVELALDHLETYYETPGGEEFSTPLEKWQHAREISCGFYYRWNPPPPKEWLNARKGWRRCVREVLALNKPGIESPERVEKAIHRGTIPPSFALLARETLSAWRAVEPTFIPNTEAVWIDKRFVDAAEKWALETGGIVWAPKAAGALFTQIPYFGEGESGDGIRSHRGPCAASIEAHGEGKNLQQWHRMLVLVCPTSATTWEQLVGRLYRYGQDKDVEVEVCLATQPLKDAWDAASSQAQYVLEMTGHRQLILRGLT
jgi:hypothetical protein